WRIKWALGPPDPTFDPNQRVHLRGRVHATGGQDMRVRIEGERNLRMAERLHHDSRVNSLREQQRRARVTQVVDTHGRQRGCGQNGIERAPDVALVKRRADGRSEDESRIRPPETCLEPFLLLSRALFFQGRDGEVRYGHGSSTPFTLRFDKLKDLTAALKHAPHTKGLVLEIDVLPGET